MSYIEDIVQDIIDTTDINATNSNFQIKGWNRNILFNILKSTLTVLEKEGMLIQITDADSDAVKNAYDTFVTLQKLSQKENNASV